MRKKKDVFGLWNLFFTGIKAFRGNCCGGSVRLSRTEMLKHLLESLGVERKLHKKGGRECEWQPRRALPPRTHTGSRAAKEEAAALKLQFCTLAFFQLKCSTMKHDFKIQFK